MYIYIVMSLNTMTPLMRIEQLFDSALSAATLAHDIEESGTVKAVVIKKSLTKRTARWR